MADAVAQVRDVLCALLELRGSQSADQVELDMFGTPTLGSRVSYKRYERTRDENQYAVPSNVT